jgi:hypothetical protein
MRYPPPITIALQPSRGYIAFAASIAIVLVALYAAFIWARPQFGMLEAVLALGGVAVCLALLRDACVQASGQLQYAQGAWLWQTDGGQRTGTLHIHLDLQRYMLVSLVANRGVLSLPNTTMQWFHLEAEQIEKTMGFGAWLDLRRAVYAGAPHHEQVVA